MPDIALEIAAGAPQRRIAGIDEAGRGPLAGPVVAATVVLPEEGLPATIARAIDDSKVLKPAEREAVLPEILGRCAVGIGRASVEEIDEVNILQATYRAMCRALDALPFHPDLALVDGNRVPPGLVCPGQCIIGGDGRSLSIAAASIVAKVTRDREMAALALVHPGYGWERNAGYGTPQHLAALAHLGPTRQHRRSFAPVAEQLSLSL